MPRYPSLEAVRLGAWQIELHRHPIQRIDLVILIPVGNFKGQVSGLDSEIRRAL
jgi:hypothetical protein